MSPFVNRRRFLGQAGTIAGLGAIAPAILLQSCGSSGSAGAPRQGGTLTVAIAAAVDTLDPAAEHTVNAQQVLEMMAEGLTAFDAKGNLVPGLATSWKASSDSKTWHFTLRKGVKFHDGTPFNAQAVKFNFDRLLSPSTTAAQPSFFTVVDSTEVVDPYHVRFNLNAPFAAFSRALTLGIGTQISPASVKVAPNTMAHIEQPVGTGPYMFKEHIKGDHVTMARNPHYWGQKPSYATQIYRISVDPAAREALLKSGQADVLATPPLNDVAALKADPSWRVFFAFGPASTGVIINNKSKTQPLLQNADVRRALNYAVDKQAIIKNLQFGLGRVLDSPFSPALPGYTKIGTYPYDPAKAKSMLQAAGATGMTVKMVVQAGGNGPQLAQIVANYLTAVGVKVVLPNPVDEPTGLAMTHVAPEKAQFDLYPASISSGDMDPSRFMDAFRPQFPPANTLNFSYYDNAQVGQLIAKGNSDASPNRMSYYHQAEKIIWNDAPWIWLFTAKNVLVTSKKISNVRYLPNNYFVTSWATPAGSV